MMRERMAEVKVKFERLEMKVKEGEIWGGRCVGVVSVIGGGNSAALAARCKQDKGH